MITEAIKWDSNPRIKYTCDVYSGTNFSVEGFAINPQVFQYTLRNISRVLRQIKYVRLIEIGLQHNFIIIHIQKE